VSTIAPRPSGVEEAGGSAVWRGPSVTVAVRRARTSGPPPTRSAVWARGLAAVLMAVIFWLDASTPLGVAVPVLYVAPAMLFIGVGHFWEPLLAAAGASVLMAVGAFVSPPGSAELGAINRPLEAVVIWVTAALVAYQRRTLAHWTAQYETDRTAIEATLERLEEMRYALDQAAIVATTDHRGLITYVNDTFCEISKYAREELLGQDHRLINSGYHPKEFFRDLWHTIARGRVWRGEIRNRAKDGTIYWVDTTIVPFMNQEGKPRQYLAIRTDITQRKAAEQQLADQAALAQLGQLAAVVAHEVRNPLAGVKGTLQIFRGRPGIEERDRQVMDAMIARLDTLNAKVEDIMRFARPRKPSFEAVNARAVILDVVESARAASAGHPVLVSPDATAIVRADREMFRAVLLNLVLNACQSGTPEPVELTLATDGARCRIAVADRGSGIPPGDADRVFDPFFTTKQSGTGLGLAIVRRLVQMQHGTIVLRPRDGGGTVAELTVPLGDWSPS